MQWCAGDEQGYIDVCSTHICKCYMLPGCSYRQHSLPWSENAGEGNTESTVPVADNDGRSVEKGCRQEGAREYRARATMYLSFFFFWKTKT